MEAYLLFDTGEKLFFSKTSEKNKYVLKRAAFMRFRGKARLTSDEWTASAGDEGYFLVPMDTHLFEDVIIEFKERTDDGFVEECQPLLPAFVIKKKNGIRLIKISHTYAWKTEVTLRNGKYSFSVVYDFDNEIADEDIIVTELMPDGEEWFDAANALRDHAIAEGELVSLKEKRKRAEVDYAALSPIIRIRMGWKPVPSPIEHQTPENEPPMHVACTFKRVRELADELKRAGIERAELQLVGWNIGGHDGRWPQAFPADERFGGDAELKKTIEHVRSLGYMIDCHYNSTDSYEIADCYDAELVAKARDGKEILGGSWGGGRSHVICPDCQVKAAEGEIKKIADAGFRGLSYSDVLSVLYPTVCFDAKHPCSTARGIRANAQTMLLHRKLMGGFSSEGTYYHALRELDYGLYTTFGTVFGIYHGSQDSSLIDRTVPFTYSVMHGTVLYNVSSLTINYPIKGDDIRLELFEKGGRPSFYFFSKFKSSGAHWMGNDDLFLTTDEEMSFAVKLIKSSCDEYDRLSHLQNEYMIRTDEPRQGVRVVEYSNGEKMLVNHTDKEVVIEEAQVSARSFVVVK